jgi:hypothetical protein
MKRSAILLSVRREYSPAARVLLALLALLQLIAPTWHVCEMGGGSCCPPPGSQATMSHCVRRAAAESAPPHCSKCLEAEAAQDGATPFAVSAPHPPFGGNCLAKLLLGMPWQSVAAQQLFCTARHRIAFTTREYSFLSSFAWALPLSRAPPFYS